MDIMHGKWIHSPVPCCWWCGRRGCRVRRDDGLLEQEAGIRVRGQLLLPFVQLLHERLRDAKAKERH